VWEDKLCEGAGCANKRRVYKLGWEVCESVWWLINYAKATVAQIRGGFINSELVVCESVWWLINCGARLVLFIKKQSIYIR